MLQIERVSPIYLWALSQALKPEVMDCRHLWLSYPHPDEAEGVFEKLVNTLQGGLPSMLGCEFPLWRLPGAPGHRMTAKQLRSTARKAQWLSDV